MMDSVDCSGSPTWQAWRFEFKQPAELRDALPNKLEGSVMCSYLKPFFCRLKSALVTSKYDCSSWFSRKLASSFGLMKDSSHTRLQS